MISEMKLILLGLAVLGCNLCNGLEISSSVSEKRSKTSASSRIQRLKYAAQKASLSTGSGEDNAGSEFLQTGSGEDNAGSEFLQTGSGEDNAGSEFLQTSSGEDNAGSELKSAASLSTGSGEDNGGEAAFLQIGSDEGEDDAGETFLQTGSGEDNAGSELKTAADSGEENGDLKYLTEGRFVQTEEEMEEGDEELSGVDLEGPGSASTEAENTEIVQFNKLYDMLTNPDQALDFSGAKGMAGAPKPYDDLPLGDNLNIEIKTLLDTVKVLRKNANEIQKSDDVVDFSCNHPACEKASSMEAAGNG